MPNDPQLDALKIPPHSMEAEQSVLGGLLLENGAADRVEDILGADDFYSDAHRLVYKTIIGLIADNKPADVVTLSEALGSLNKLEYTGGMPYLGALVENVPTAAVVGGVMIRDRGTAGGGCVFPRSGWYWTPPWSTWNALFWNAFFWNAPATSTPPLRRPDYLIRRSDSR